MPVVVTTPRALAQIRDIMVYLEENASPEIAEQFTWAIQSALEQLGSMPRMGREGSFEHPKLSDIRVWRAAGKFSDYLLFYRVVENGIELLHVLHGARDIPSYFHDFIEHQ